MKTMVLAVPSLLISFWLVMTKMTGFKEMLPQGMAAGVVMFVMMIALGVAIYEIVETIVNGIGSGDLGAYFNSQMKTVIISAVVAIAVLVIGFAAPAIM